MLEFFRKYQRYFFAVITVVIIISFSFFGTYSTIMRNGTREQIAFTAIDGTQVPRHELDEMVLFIGTDADDKLLMGGLWGPNFLNDGVVSKDFFETGLASRLIEQYPQDVNPDLVTRLEREKRFVPYVHPQAPFITLKGTWEYFVPNMTEQFDLLKASLDPSDSKAFEARVGLFLGQRQFPAPMASHVLRYQEKQYSWVPPDPSLEREDLSLFGYHTLEDWFGPRFIRLVAEFIINAAKIAEMKGYEVTKNDAWTDLIRHSEMSFQQNISNPNLGVANSREYFSEQLRRLSMDRNKAVKIWRQVMLFRRLFHDLGNAMFVDPFTFEQFNTYAQETVGGQMFRLPEELRLGNYRALQKLEVYLNALSNRSTKDKSSLMLPSSYLSVEEVFKKSPELVQKRYLLDIAQIDKNSLQGKVGVRESWNWEVEDQNWDRLKKQFPELGLQKGETREERFAALDRLDDKTRARVDAFARSAIVENHPEWMDKALDEAPIERKVVILQTKGGASPIAGLEDRAKLIRLLDKNSDQLTKFTADNIHYYRLTTIDRSPQQEILTFAEADKAGVLDEMLDAQLKAYYPTIRDKYPQEFQREDQTWKPFSEVKDLVADHYFEPILKAIRKDYAQAIAPEIAPKQMIGDFSASLRFYAYAREAKAQIEKNPESLDQWSRQPKQEEAVDKLEDREPLTAQWEFIRTSATIIRGEENRMANKEAILSLGENQWSPVNTSANGDLYFFQVESKGRAANHEKVIAQVDKARDLLSDDAQQRLMILLLREMKDKNALSLDYLNQTVEMTEPVPQPMYDEI